MFVPTAIMTHRVPRFIGENQINVTLYQNYPAALKDLTPVEEVLIAKCHPVGPWYCFKTTTWWLSISCPGVNYDAVKGHFVIIPILPSPELQPQNLFKVFWLNDRPPTNDALKLFLLLRKTKEYLVRHNQNLTTNYLSLDGRLDRRVHTSRTTK
jgi:uncharacterized protein DUF6570